MRWLNQLKGMLGGLAQGSSAPASQTPQPRRPTPGAAAAMPPAIPIEQRGPRSLVEADLCRLNASLAGLGDAAVHYVLTGGNPDVLQQLESSGLGKRIEAQGAFPHRDSVIRGRYHVLGILLPHEPELCQRYVQVLTASLATGHERPSALPGVPLQLQDYLNNLMHGTVFLADKERVETFKSSFTIDTLSTFAKQLGATTADLVAALYNEPQRYSSYKIGDLRRQLDCKALLLADPAALGPVVARLGEAGRVSLLNDVTRLKLAAEEPGLGLVMDLAGNNLKAVREAAGKTVTTLDPALREAEALKRLKSGDATLREAMAGILVSLGTPTARAALDAHLPGERAAAVRAVIERMTKADVLRSAAPEADNATGYVALGGLRIDVPLLRPFRVHGDTRLGPEDQASLSTIFQPFADRLAAEEAARKAKYPNGTPNRLPQPESVPSLIVFLNGNWAERAWRKDFHFTRMLNEGAGKSWVLQALSNLSQETGLRFAICAESYLDSLLIGNRTGSATASVFGDYADAPEGDLRQVFRLTDEFGLTVRHGSSGASAAAAFLSGRIRQDRYDRGQWLRGYSADFVWPCVAEHLTTLDRAVQPDQRVALTDITKVLAVLRVLPATPDRFVALLFDIATGTSRDGRADARALLAGLPKLDDHLTEMLADKRQAVRATVADWLADLGAKSVVPALEKALAKETAAKPRAAMLGALRRLGGNLEPFVGEAVLNRAAAEGIRKADFGTLSWMDFKAMPRLTWTSGAPMPHDTQMFWLYQALRLKAPGETEMFAVYLDRCDLSSAQTFSTWVFDAWLDWAETDAPLRSTWTDKDPRNGMPKSIESKGILALGVAADSRHAARRVRAFLKKNGQQSQHCAALIELLAAKGDAASLQIVLAAATRIKQKSLQKLAGDLVTAIAEEHGWTTEELADRTVPDCGLDDDGSADLPLGEGRPDARMLLNDALELVLMNGAGQLVKSFPTIDTPEATDSKSLWAATKKEVSATVEMQAGRLYDAMIAGRSWALEDWQRDTLGHPIMAALASQLVWQGLGEDGQPLVTFRPLSGGGAMGPLGDRVTLDGTVRVRLAHGALMTDADTAAWEAFVKPRRTKAPVTQFGRPVRRLHPDMGTQTQIADREGWVTDTFTIRSSAKRLGYERGEIVDSGGFSTYVRRFTGAGYDSVLTFSGSGVPEENLPASPLHVSFRNIGGRGEMPLSKVPPVLLSEGWNDYHELATKGRYDPNWLKLMPFM